MYYFVNFRLNGKMFINVHKKKKNCFGNMISFTYFLFSSKRTYLKPTTVRNLNVKSKLHFYRFCFFFFIFYVIKIYIFLRVKSTCQPQIMIDNKGRYSKEYFIYLFQFIKISVLCECF